MLTGAKEEAKAEYTETISFSQDERLNEYCSKALASQEGQAPLEEKPSPKPAAGKPETV
jgi:hypothetical protein